MIKLLTGHMSATGIFCLLLTCLAWSNSAQAIIITETEFAGWSSQIVVDTSMPGPATVGDQVLAAGGNPGGYFEQRRTYADGTVRAAVFGDLLWDPDVTGAIERVSFSVDAIQLTGVQIPGDTVHFVLQQDGVVYRYGVSLLAPNAAGWVTLSHDNLVHSQFVPQLADDSVIPTQHPDFTAGGSLISFGVMIGDKGTDDRVTGLDNFVVAINEAPVPSSLVLFLAAMVMGRRKLA